MVRSAQKSGEKNGVFYLISEKKEDRRTVPSGGNLWGSILFGISAAGNHRICIFQRIPDLKYAISPVCYQLSEGDDRDCRESAQYTVHNCPDVAGGCGDWCGDSSLSE